MSEQLRTQAVVPTGAARYVKQLVSHLGRKVVGGHLERFGNGVALAVRWQEIP
jgi:hypothetical protein